MRKSQVKSSVITEGEGRRNALPVSFEIAQSAQVSLKVSFFFPFNILRTTLAFQQFSLFPSVFRFLILQLHQQLCLQFRIDACDFMRTVKALELPLLDVPLLVHFEVGAHHCLLAQLLPANLLLHFSDHLRLILRHPKDQVGQVFDGVLDQSVVRKGLSCLTARGLEDEAFVALDPGFQRACCIVYVCFLR